MHLFGFLTIAAVLKASGAEVNCWKHPPRVNLSNCCELANLFSEEVREKCALQDDKSDGFGPRQEKGQGPPNHHHGRGGPPKFGPHKHRFLSCVINETGILIDNEFQEENVTSYLNELFDSSEKVEFLKDKFLVCNEKRENMEEKRHAHSHHADHWPWKQNGMLLACARKEAFMDCPDSFWSGTDECNEVRDHFNECDFFKKLEAVPE